MNDVVRARLSLPEVQVAEQCNVLGAIQLNSAKRKYIETKITKKTSKRTARMKNVKKIYNVMKILGNSQKK